jgi:hypothetical protein
MYKEKKYKKRRNHIVNSYLREKNICMDIKSQKNEINKLLDSFEKSFTRTEFNQFGYRKELKSIKRTFNTFEFMYGDYHFILKAFTTLTQKKFYLKTYQLIENFDSTLTIKHIEELDIISGTLSTDNLYFIEPKDKYIDMTGTIYNLQVKLNEINMQKFEEQFNEQYIAQLYILITNKEIEEYNQITQLEK